MMADICAEKSLKLYMRTLFRTKAAKDCSNSEMRTLHSRALRAATSHSMKSDIVVLQMTMVDLLLAILHWLLSTFFGGQAFAFVGLVLWTIWTGALKPRLIPVDDIVRVAGDIIASYPDPELEAFARHKRAWNRSEGAKQTYWYRVRKAVRRRLRGR
ncbi:hypothetical protein [Brucella melitensis]|nr:conserved hypothetical protein [Brucella melitensis bv. 3 str. Ether]EPZ76728.1 hypothetical protein M798_03285 [Brucella melitensis ADMAS-G1]